MDKADVIALCVLALCILAFGGLLAEGMFIIKHSRRDDDRD